MKYRGKIRSLEVEIKQILKQEEEEKQLRLMEMEINKATNLVEHRNEIMSRPARTWIKTTGKKRPAPDRGEGGMKGIGESSLLSKRAKREEIRKGLAKKRKNADTVSLKRKAWQNANSLLIHSVLVGRGEDITLCPMGTGVCCKGCQKGKEEQEVICCLSWR